MLSSLLSSLQAGDLRSVATFPLHLVGMAAHALFGRSEDEPWVIGGHRGRAYDDNSAGLHGWLAEEGAHPAIWIANKGPTFDRLKARGYKVLKRGSWAARRAIARAPVLVYSHGEDDLDLLLRLARPIVGVRVHVNHSFNVIKAGNAYAPYYEQSSPFKQWLLRQAMIDFDILPAASELEAHFFRLALPHAGDNVLSYGGAARLDETISLRALPAEPFIYYFPTFRDTEEGKRGLDETLRALLKRQDLRDWLEREGLSFYIGAHINTGAQPLEIEPPFALREMTTLKADLASASLFISDYSGLLADHLVFDRPVMAFPFDRESYLSHRRLFMPLEEIVTGPIANSLDELVDTLLSGEWQDFERYRQKRDELRELIGIRFDHRYAEGTYKAITSTLAERRKAKQ